MVTNLENSEAALELEKISFYSNPKYQNTKKCSNYHTIVFISYASKVMLKILQAKLQEYSKQELSDLQAAFRKGRAPETKLPTFVGS